ncbi:LysE family transporter [uncultured Aquabacterium sp.]|jgi:homoserine/homoserine lactone efflux protein|uniref:LysE family transporter n=1 Tax=uncultured Aquabacterium sp. TaxID=158753 RepID=UPI00261084B8|nr:LysE family transporter [uncultured Aquabacterium sp.]
MDLHVWMAYVAAMTLISVSPGSGALLTMTHSMARGVRGVMPGVLGLQVGLVAVLLVSGVGLGAVLLASEQAFTALKWAGAAYLVWLGIGQWRAATREPEVLADTPANGATWRMAVTAATPARVCFAQGVLTNVTNPKGIVFMVAVLPQFLDPARPLWLQLLICSATSVVIDLIVMRLGYAHVAAGLQRLMKRPSARRVRDRLFGGVLMALGASLVFVKRAAS